MVKTAPKRFYSAFDVGLVHWLRARKNTLQRISDFLKCSKSTVSRLLLREPETPLRRVASAKKRASVNKRREVLRQIADARVVRNGKRRPKFASLRQIATEYRLRAVAATAGRKSRPALPSRSTISRDLRASGYRCVVRKRVCTIAAVDHQARREFCLIHRCESTHPRKIRAQRIIFSDEKNFHCERPHQQDNVR